MPAPLTPLLPAAATLIGVLGLILLLGRLAAWRSGGLALRGAAAGRLSIEASLALDGRRRLYLIRCDNRRFLLLTGGGGDLLLGWLPDGEAQ